MFIYIQISDLTGRTMDDAWTALHDCDNDVPRAVDRLLDKQDDQVRVLAEVNEGMSE